MDQVYSSTCACLCHSASADVQAHATHDRDFRSVDIIDAQLLGLSRSVQHMKARRNSLVPVNHLPAEMLQRVFGYVAAAALNPIDTADLGAKYSQYAEVCQYWRAVALETAALWTCPPFKHPRLAQEFLERSNSMPIHVQARFSSMLPGETLRTVMAHEGRIQSIVFDLENSDTLHRFPDELYKPFPHLRDVTLSIDREEDDAASSWTFELYRPFFELEPLHHLVLRGICLPFSHHSLFGNLTTLVLDPGDQSVRMDVCEVLEIFQHNPLLSRIKMRNAFTCDDMDIPSVGEPMVNLHFLEELYLHDPDEATAITRLIARIHLPLGAHLDICTLEYVRIIMDTFYIGRLVHELATAAQATVDSCLHYRYVDFNERGGDLFFRAWTEQAHNKQPRTALRTHFTTRQTSDADFAAKSMIAKFPIYSAKYWKITGDLSTTWLDARSEDCISLTHLWTDGIGIGPFLLAVLKDKDASLRDGQMKWPCEDKDFRDSAPALPHLSALVVEDADFKCAVETRTRGMITLSETLLVAITQCFRLEELHLLGCINLLNSSREALSRFVPLVVITPESFAASRKSGGADKATDEFMYPQDDFPGWFRLLAEPY